MANEMVVVEKVTRGHSKSSFKVISKYKGDLTKNFDQVCVWYHLKGYLSGPWESDNGHWDAGSGYWRSLTKVIWRYTLIYCEVSRGPGDSLRKADQRYCEVWSGLCLIIYIRVWAMGVEVSVAVLYVPRGYF